MTDHRVHFKGDREPDLEGIVTVDGEIVPLAGCTVKLQMRLATSSTLKVNAAAVVVNPATAAVRYDWAAVDVDTAGFYVYWWHVTDGSGEVLTTEEELLEIREHAPLAGALTSLEAVRQHLQKDEDERALDPEIVSVLLATSKAFMAETGREFAPPVTGVTRRFRVKPRRRNPRTCAYLVDFGHFDLRTATAISLHPESSSPTVLTALEDYALVEDTNPDAAGVHTGLELAAAVSLASDVASRFGFAYLDITGNWGFPTVPIDVEELCKVQVAIHLRREVQAFTKTYRLDAGFLERPESIASHVRQGLNRWSRPRFA